MRAKEIITEFEYTDKSPFSKRNMSFAQVVNEIKTRCTDFIPFIQNLDPDSRGNFLYRGMSTTSEDGEFFVAWPATGSRGSTNVPNHYRLLLDTSPYYKGWPKRGNSFLCATVRGKAEQYSRGTGAEGTSGNLYCVIPINGTKIAACPGEDIWRTMADFGPLYSANGSSRISFRQISSFFEHDIGAQIDYTGKFDDSTNSWRRTSKSGGRAYSDKITPEDAANRVITPAIKEFCEQRGVDPKNFWTIIDQGMSPEITGMRLVTTKTFSEVKDTNHECWIGDPVILFSSDRLRAVQQALNENTNKVVRNRNQDQENLAANVIVELCTKNVEDQTSKQYGDKFAREYNIKSRDFLSQHATNIVNYINTPIRSGNVNIDQASIQIMALLNKLNFESAVPSVQRIKKYMEQNQIPDKKTLANHLISKWRTKQKPKQAVHPPEYVSPTKNTSSVQSLSGTEKFPVTGLAGAALGVRKATNLPR